jgi:O-antigen/teichoic acid export membrane protein
MNVVNDLTQKAKTLQARIISGSIVMLSGSSLTTAINLTYNIVVARYIGPKGFGQATVVYTILTLISAVMLSFQIVSSKAVARHKSPEEAAGVYRSFHRGAWAVGILIGLLLMLFQRSIAEYLNLSSPVLIALLAVGATFYIPLGTRRGYIQGTYGFRRLAANLVLEGSVRLGGSFLLIVSGMGVDGVIAANTAAIAVAYLAIAPKLSGRTASPLRFLNALHETSHAMIFFAGQVLINNCDIVLVQHFFIAREAGIYAAVAMVGRVIFAFSSAVVNSMFPLVAGTQDEERKDLKVIATSLLMVLGTGSVLALGLSVAPAGLWATLFGPGFEISGKYNLPYLLALYAVTTIVYSLSVVMITFEMSYKIANTSWIQMAFSGIVIACIIRFHSSLREVILVQLILMVFLFVFVAVPFVIDLLRHPNELLATEVKESVRLIRRVSEDEVIAEFLKSDFHVPAFREYQTILQNVVSNPDLGNAEENAKRRALLFIRHLALWKEIPTDTEWYEVEVKQSDVSQIRVFPRAQWRKLAHGDFSITEIAEGLRIRQHLVDRPFLSKISDIGEQLISDNPGVSSVILIGLTVSEPLTVLDGNHRLVAAISVSPYRLEKLRFLCGLSPRMSECCWYKTNFVTLFRYARNMLALARRNPENELARLL